MATAKALVPLQRVAFRGGYVVRGVGILDNPGVELVVEPLPRNTLDVRYPYCTDHRTACVCREAELAEERAELRWYLREAKDAVAEVLAGHRTWPESYRQRFIRWDVLAGPVHEYEWDDDAVCMCTGCQIARKAYLR
jgi:hypothetical protein